MEITIRPYEERDRAAIIGCMHKEQEYLAGLDPMKQFKLLEGGAEHYLNWILNEVQTQDGIIYLACDEEKVIGFIAGYVTPQDEEDQLIRQPALPGAVQDLFVDEAYRSKGIGAQLMQKLEEYLKSKGCDEVWVDAFIPNPRSLKFYEKLGYKGQFVEYLKKI